MRKALPRAIRIRIPVHVIIPLALGRAGAFSKRR